MSSFEEVLDDVIVFDVIDGCVLSVVKCLPVTLDSLLSSSF